MQREPDELTRDVIEATAAGVERSRLIHKALGLPIVIWRDGRAVWVDPLVPPCAPGLEAVHRLRRDGFHARHRHVVLRLQHGP